ncbi:MAG: UDP-N-acetylmuramate dehydrogenase [Clostridia bacterium]|nr:UDP-N-acetylmuramate dehydrogenase [Clostridia bacterium]
MDFLKSLENFTKDKVYENYCLKSNCGYVVGGNAKYYVEPTTVVSLRTIIELSTVNQVKYKVIGNGTNLLISDNGYDGIVICTRRIKGIKENNGKVVCSSGENLSSLINFCLENGYCGLEQLCGIPATVGGAVVMNASAYKKCISDYIESVDLLRNGKLLRLDKHDLCFGYRKSILQQLKLPILTVNFRFPKQRKKIESKELIKYYSVLRHDNQPKGKSCGSVFRNTNSYKAGYIIDQAGLKDLRVGKAKVSSKHANFIVTEDGATASDVYTLIKLIKTKIKEQFNVELIEEIEYVGEF